MENLLSIVRFDGAFPFDQPMLRTTIGRQDLSRQLLRKGLFMYFDQEAFGKRLRELRKEKGLSQERVAEAVNVSLVHYRFIERGSRGCSIDLLLDFADFYQVSTDYLLIGRSANRKQETDQLKSVLSVLEKLIQKM